MGTRVRQGLGAQGLIRHHHHWPSPRPKRPPKHAHPNTNMIRTTLVALAILINLPQFSAAQEKTIRVGIIGLDTSHVPAFTRSMNATPADPDMKGCQVIAAYPYGSRTIETSSSRIPKYTAEVKAMGVEVVDSIPELLKRVDCVLLETNDGTMHLDQAIEVFKAGKPVFIDKPVASNLAEAVAIFQAAEHFGVPMFSSSSLRYSAGPQAIRGGSIGDVLGCNTYSPASLEPSHTDLFWYGIHGVELLYTCMGTGCQSVSHTSTKDREFVVGTWDGGRIGTFHGMRNGKKSYGGTAFGSKAIAPVGKYDGYQPLVKQITAFFDSRQPPIAPQETIELYAFMEAAAESKKQGGAKVAIAGVLQRAQTQAEQLLRTRL